MGGMLKKIFIVAIILSVFALLGLLYIQTKPIKEKLPVEFHTYKIFITHNDKPVEISYTGLAYNNFTYGIEVYNKSSACSQFVDVTNIQSPNYMLDSNVKIDGKPLKDYEKEGYAFRSYVSAYPSDINTGWSVAIAAKDVFDIALNYEELPKLSQNFSITIDVPIFNRSSSSHWNKISGENMNIHAELLDDWNKKNNFYCLLRRNYEAGDGNLPDCPKQLAIFHQNQQCAQKYLSVCGIPNRVAYMVEATRNGKNIDCSFPFKSLTPEKNYEVRIYMYDQINPNLYFSYRGGNFTGNILVPLH